jgi:hypothetical protein
MTSQAQLPGAPPGAPDRRAWSLDEFSLAPQNACVRNTLLSSDEWSTMKTMGRTAALVVAVLLATVGGAPGEVRVSAEGVRVQSMGQPLSEVLAQLSQAASFKVKYEGAAPSVRVYATIESRSVSEGVGRLLEGTGVTWAARFDSTGTKIELLIVGGPIQASTAQAAAGRPAASRPPVEAMPEPPEEVYEPPPMMEPQPEPDPQPPPQPPSAPPPSVQPSFSGGISGSPSWSPSVNPPPTSLSAPVNSGIGWSQPNTPTPTPQAPQIPSGASLP